MPPPTEGMFKVENTKEHRGRLTSFSSVAVYQINAGVSKRSDISVSGVSEILDFYYWQRLNLKGLSCPNGADEPKFCCCVFAVKNYQLWTINETFGYNLAYTLDYIGRSDGREVPRSSDSPTDAEIVRKIHRKKISGNIHT